MFERLQGLVDNWISRHPLAITDEHRLALSVEADAILRRIRTSIRRMETSGEEAGDIRELYYLFAERVGIMSPVTP